MPQICKDDNTSGEGKTEDKAGAAEATETAVVTAAAGVPVLSEEEEELAEQVLTIFQAFLKASLDWTGGDDELHFDHSDLSLVKGKSFPNPDDELLIITHKSESTEQFNQEFLIKIRPKVIQIVNTIVNANNSWLEATNFHRGHLTQDDVEAMLKLYIDPEVTEDMYADDNNEAGIHYKAIGFRRASGNSLCRWDYTEECPDYFIERYKNEPKGTGKKLALVE
jgi:hypothetical protein